ncbi:hypothetical protein Desgi_3928 [Desulfoscipio gibsoniae DSM 7213]|uniref:Uncharacterized protein n=1 Tax=Desulfoscipio gibsoniae DSM 7213 TaxID=767817 RepID=R4KUB3_9FIRM|nr:hypothetical protein Desgi_3928 [Desulfoscipio gibsoniae DSM 7213]
MLPQKFITYKLSPQKLEILIDKRSKVIGKAFAGVVHPAALIKYSAKSSNYC